MLLSAEAKVKDAGENASPAFLLLIMEGYVYFGLEMKLIHDAWNKHLN